VTAGPGLVSGARYKDAVATGRRSGAAETTSTEAAELRLGWKMAALAFTMASEVGAGALLGWVFDRLAGTRPNGVLVGAVLGIAVGMLGFVRGALRLNRLLSEQEKARPRMARPLPTAAEPDDSWDRDARDDQGADADDWDNDPTSRRRQG
jgi:F0F1-type ATP synthase assembly protein I